MYNACVSKAKEKGNFWVVPRAQVSIPETVAEISPYISFIAVALDPNGGRTDRGTFARMQLRHIRNHMGGLHDLDGFLHVIIDGRHIPLVRQGQ
jgi:hypothetical protein